MYTFGKKISTVSAGSIPSAYTHPLNYWNSFHPTPLYLSHSDSGVRLYPGHFNVRNSLSVSLAFFFLRFILTWRILGSSCHTALSRILHSWLLIICKNYIGVILFLTHFKTICTFVIFWSPFLQFIDVITRTVFAQFIRRITMVLTNLIKTNKQLRYLYYLLVR